MNFPLSVILSFLAAGPVAAQSLALPPAVAREFQEWKRQCAPDGEAEFSNDYLTIVDIDGDGHDDYILNGDGVTCIANGQITARGGGNGGTSLKIFTHKGKTVVKALDVFTQGADIRAHKGFAVVNTLEGSYRIANGKASVVKPSNGGNTVYTLGR